MAYLKSGSTVNGHLILTQGSLPITPVGDSVHYKEFKIFTEHDTPTAEQVDAVSKSKGGSYDKAVTFPEITIKGTKSLTIKPTDTDVSIDVEDLSISTGGNVNLKVSSVGSVTARKDITSPVVLITGNSTADNSATKRSDVVLKGSIIDFGEF
ncbi:putative long tail fiber distal connector [Morganella phage vB_MmoM_Rgz1]|nr:putative long tail fiber distal connector [Morganella phage vB_MmoM_Rgz1]